MRLRILFPVGAPHYLCPAWNNCRGPTNRWPHHVGTLLLYLFIRLHVPFDPMVCRKGTIAIFEINQRLTMIHDTSIPAEMVKARPEKLPEPTYWPFFLALGLALAGWGLLSTWIISLGGLIVCIIALIGWVKILRHE